MPAERLIGPPRKHEIGLSSVASFFFKLHALDARQMRPRERTAVRLSISFPRPVVHPPKGPPKDTGIRIEGSSMCERKEDGKKYEDTSSDKD